MNDLATLLVAAHFMSVIVLLHIHALLNSRDHESRTEARSGALGSFYRPPRSAALASEAS